MRRRLVTGQPYQAGSTSRRAKVFRTSSSRRARRLTWPRNQAGTASGINDLGERAPLIIGKKVSTPRAFATTMPAIDLNSPFYHEFVKHLARGNSELEENFIWSVKFNVLHFDKISEKFHSNIIITKSYTYD